LCIQLDKQKTCYVNMYGKTLKKIVGISFFCFTSGLLCRFNILTNSPKLISIFQTSGIVVPLTSASISLTLRVDTTVLWYDGSHSPNDPSHDTASHTRTQQSCQRPKSRKNDSGYTWTTSLLLSEFQHSSAWVGGEIEWKYVKLSRCTSCRFIFYT
jgi:hypothetical protein